MRPIKELLIIMIVILGFLDGCRAPGLMPRLILQGEDVGDDFWLAAPYVLVVKIVAADPQGSREPVFSDGPRVLQLVKFTANVENTIKGDILDKTITFFFFAKVDQNPIYYLDPGKRYIISLRREGGVLRSWADASQLKIWVHSGSHSQRDLPLDLGTRAAITYILLTPGPDCDPSEFGKSLGWPPYASDDPAYINQRLKRLESNPDRTIRDSACLASATMFSHRPECLEQAILSPDSNVRRAAGEFLKGDSIHLLERLQHNAFSLFPKPWTDYMSQEFEIYTEDVRPAVRKAACASLRNLAPLRAVERCR